MGATAIRQTPAVEIPNKLYFRIGDVAKLTGIKAYVLRYWETEFPMLAPKKSGANQRLYRRKDVQMVLEIKRLLYEERFTIEGARSHLQQRRHTPKPAPAPKPKPAALISAQASLFGASAVELAQIRDELRALLSLLEA